MSSDYELVSIKTSIPSTTSLFNFSKVRLLLLLLLILLFYSYMYVNDPFNVRPPLQVPDELIDTSYEKAFDQFNVFKIENFSIKNFTVKDVVLLTAFSQDHFIEALLFLIL